MIVFPIFRSNPLRVVGIPVPFATCFFTWVTPKNRFHENENPRIWVVFNGLIINESSPGDLSGRKTATKFNKLDS